MHGERLVTVVRTGGDAAVSCGAARRATPRGSWCAGGRSHLDVEMLGRSWRMSKSLQKWSLPAVIMRLDSRGWNSMHVTLPGLCAARLRSMSLLLRSRQYTCSHSVRLADRLPPVHCRER